MKPSAEKRKGDALLFGGQPGSFPYRRFPAAAECLKFQLPAGKRFQFGTCLCFNKESLFFIECVNGSVPDTETASRSVILFQNSIEKVRMIS